MRTARLLLLFTVLATATSSIAAPAPPVLPDVVIVETNHGTFKIKLYPDKAPKSVANFLKYVDDKHYDGLIFHRVIPNFVIQGGGLDADMTDKKSRDPVPNEAGNGLTHKRGTVAVARAADPNSGRSQFYINLKDNDFLDKLNPGYCVFGEVIDGMDVVDKIAKVPTGMKGQHSDVPMQPVIIKTVSRSRP